MTVLKTQLYESSDSLQAPKNEAENCSSFSEHKAPNAQKAAFTPYSIFGGSFVMTHYFRMVWGRARTIWVFLRLKLIQYLAEKKTKTKTYKLSD